MYRVTAMMGLGLPAWLHTVSKPDLSEIELRGRYSQPSFVETENQIMENWIDPRRRHIGIGLEIDVGVEITRRIPVLSEVDAVEMGFGILAGAGYV
jgi:hypothetical protein